MSWPFLSSYGAVWSGHSDVVSDDGEICLSCFLYWKSSGGTSALVIEVFVISVIYVDGAIRAISRFVPLHVFHWQWFSYSYQTAARKVPFIWALLCCPGRL